MKCHRWLWDESFASREKARRMYERQFHDQYVWCRGTRWRSRARARYALLLPSYIQWRNTIPPQYKKKDIMDFKMYCLGK